MLYGMATLFFNLNSTKFNCPTFTTQLCMFAFVPLCVSKRWWVSMKLFRRFRENSFLKCKCSCTCQWGLWLNPVNKKANSSSPLSHPSTRGSDTHILSFAFWGKRVWNMSLNISLWKLSGMYSHTENPFDILRTNNRAITVNDLRVCVCACEYVLESLHWSRPWQVILAWHHSHEWRPSILQHCESLFFKTFLFQLNFLFVVDRQ